MDQVTERKGETNVAFWLFIVFLVLKLVHVIGWSWWWVTAPLWIPAIFVGGVFVLIAIGAIIVGLSQARR